MHSIIAYNTWQVLAVTHLGVSIVSLLLGYKRLFDQGSPENKRDCESPLAKCVIFNQTRSVVVWQQIEACVKDDTWIVWDLYKSTQAKRFPSQHCKEVKSCCVVWIISVNLNYVATLVLHWHFLDSIFTGPAPCSVRLGLYHLNTFKWL